MINPITTIQEKMTASINSQIQVTTNELIDSAYHKFTTFVKGRLGYEIVVTDEDKFKRVYTLLKRLNPEKYKENSVVKITGSRLFASGGTKESLRSGANYTIKIPNAKAYLHIHYIYDNLRLYIIGVDAKQIYLLIQNALRDREVTLAVEKAKTTSSCRVFTVAFDAENELYTRGGNKTPAKGFDNIYTDETSKQHLISYIDKWKHSSDLFSSIGISHKLGILLYGEPGTGKTSISKTIAAYLGCNLYTVSLNKLKPEYISEFRQLADDHENTVILLEDIDYVFGKREQEFTQEQRVAGQALLQLLDGAENLPRTIFIATTNDIDSLDDAITRDGRFDLKINMTNIDRDTAGKMCKEFRLTEEQTNELLADEAFPINPAHLQNKAIQYIFSHIEDMNYDDESENLWI